MVRIPNPTKNIRWGRGGGGVIIAEEKRERILNQTK